jgi:hypothetical protein
MEESEAGYAETFKLILLIVLLNNFRVNDLW